MYILYSYFLAMTTVVGDSNYSISQFKAKQRGTVTVEEDNELPIVLIACK